MENDLKIAVAHGLRSFDQTGIHLPQGGLDLPRKERSCSKHQRYDRAPYTDRGPHQQPGQRQQAEKQNDKRDRSEQVDELVQHLIDCRIRQNSISSGHRQNRTEKHAQEKGDQARRQNHLQRFQNTLLQYREGIGHIGQAGLKPLLHPSTPPLLHSFRSDMRSPL